MGPRSVADAELFDPLLAAEQPKRAAVATAARAIESVRADFLRVISLLCDVSLNHAERRRIVCVLPGAVVPIAVL